jgi:hypothetical protein
MVVTAVLFVSVSTAAASEQVLGQPDLTVSTPEIELSSGEQTTLPVYVNNEGRLRQGGAAEWVDRVTTARATSIDIRSGNTPIEVNTGTVSAGSIPAGSSGPFDLTVTVPADTEPGRYELPVRLQYSYTSLVTYGDRQPELNDAYRDTSARLVVRVGSEPRFGIDRTTSSAQIGDNGRVTVRMTNTGTERVDEAAIGISAESDEITFGTGSQRSETFVGSWAPGETKTATYSIETSDDALRRSYSLTTTVEYTDTDGIAGSSRSMKTSVSPVAEQRFELTDVDASLRVGEEGRVNGTVVNRGPQPVSNAVVRFGANDPNLNVESTAFAIGQLAVGEAATFGYDVTISDAASASAQQLNFTVRYRNERDDARVSDPLERTIDIAPRRDRFSVSAIDRSVVAGNTTALEIQVTNEGDEPLRNVEAKAFMQDPLSSGDDEGLIPTLEPGESRTFTIGLSAGSGALEKTYPVSVDFQYEMPDGDTEVSQSYTVPIAVAAAQPDGLPLRLIGAVGVLVVVLAGGLWWRRRSK